MLELVDEFRHTPGSEPLWTEAWYFDAVAPDVSWAMYARLALCPNLGHAWWWSVIVRAGAPMLLVRDQHLDLPRRFEVRGDGLWADLTCHEPMKRWQMNFEGFAVALDDPSDAYTHERGDRVPLEFEYEWDAAGEPFAITDGYGQRCVVATDFDDAIPGYRSHTWGVPAYSATAARAEPATPHLIGGLLVDVPNGERTALHRVATRDGWMEWLAPT